MGEIVRLDEARARALRSRRDQRELGDRWAPQPRSFELVECGSGWYHEEAIRASKAPSAQPR